ncbi:MAG: BamA/TamA family outer membrane protein, partial [bacterium]
MHVYLTPKYFRFFLPFLLQTWLSTASSQIYQPLPDSSSVKNWGKIFTILVQGNEKTKEEIILREMKLKPGDNFDAMEAERDRLRIQNLGIFNRVELDMVPTNNGVILVVTVTEMWYIFPYPIIFRNDRDWGRISVGAGLLHNNFRGRREIIDFSFWLGFNPSVRLRYTNPWILGKLKFYTSLSLFAKKVRNLSFTVQDSSVNENQIGFNWRIGKRFGHFTYFDVNFGYKQLTLSPNSPGNTLSASGKDKLPHAGLSFTYDSRDLWEYAHRGHYFKIWAQKTGWPSTVIDYFRYGADVRKFIPIGPTTLAFHGAANFSTGKIPIYDQVHFGFLTR